MSNKNVYLKGQSRYIRPYFCDTGENLPDGDLKNKLQKAIEMTNEKLQLNVPLGIDVQVGKTYADVH